MKSSSGAFLQICTSERCRQIKEGISCTDVRLCAQVYVSQLLPAHRKQHAAAVGRNALVVHYAYFVQEKGLLFNAPGLLLEYSR